MTKLALSCVGSAVPDKTVREYWAVQKRLLPHANRCLESTHVTLISEWENSGSILNAAHNLGALYFDQGKMKEAEEMCLQALAGYEKAWGPEHTSTLNTVNNLGALYLKRGKMKEAEEMYLRALAGKEKAWGPEHKQPLDTRYNLAAMYKEKSMFEEAAKHFELVVQGYTKVLGPENAETFEALNQLEKLVSLLGTLSS